jgi:hypothetical protein
LHPLVLCFPISLPVTPAFFSYCHVYIYIYIYMKPYFYYYKIKIMHKNWFWESMFHFQSQRKDAHFPETLQRLYAMCLGVSLLCFFFWPCPCWFILSQWKHSSVLKEPRPTSQLCLSRCFILLFEWMNCLA